MSIERRRRSISSLDVRNGARAAIARGRATKARRTSRARVSLHESMTRRQLLADAETREDVVEEVVRRPLAGDLLQRMRRLLQIEEWKLFGHPTFEC